MILFSIEHVMKPNFRAAASAGLLLSAAATGGDAATMVQTTVGPHAAGSNYDLIFSTPLTSVEQLVSISDGSVYTGEGATMTVSAVLTNDQVVQIYSTVPSPFQNVSLSSLTNNTFTPLASPQDVKALRFSSTGGNIAATFAFPALTVLTFAVVPEPAAAAMMLLGCVFLAFRRRKMAA